MQITTQTAAQIYKQTKQNLDRIPGGIAGNKVFITVGDIQFEARGFIVKEDNSVICALSWGMGQSLESLCLSVSFKNEAAVLETFEARSALKRLPEFWDNAAESFFIGISQKLKAKVYRFENNITGGSPSKSVRLEAWPAHRKAPADKFDAVLNILFTTMFIKIARKNNVTYK